jgi:polyisoprenoid-binding protein YceI
VVIGDTYTFDIVGDLTILNTTNSVTFSTTVTVNSEENISGTAETSVLYADWGISIPDAIGVADVTDDVTLTIDFEAGEVQE